MRVNARLSPESAEQMAYLQEATGAGVSDVVRESLSLYYTHVRRQKSPGLLHFAQHIGQWDSGHADTASNWKQVLGESLEAKHGLPPLTPRPDK